MGMFGPAIRNVVDITDAKDIIIKSNAVVYTRAIPLNMGVYFGLKYKAISATGSPSIKIEMELSDRLPTTEGSADDHYVVPEGISDIESDLTTELWKITTLSPVPMPYMRFKVTGSGTNEADTILNLNLSVQEDY